MSEHPWHGWREHVERYLREQADYEAWPVQLDDPPPPRDPWAGAFLIHVNDTGAAGMAQAVRGHIAAGRATGVFMYTDKDTPLAPSKYQAELIASGPPCHVEWSPKNVSDPNGLMAWGLAWPLEWLPYVRVAYWQEFQGDFGVQGTPPIREWQAGVFTLANAMDVHGIKSMAHAETWNLSDSQPDGGTPRLRQFLEPVMDRLTGITWSYFMFALQDKAAELIPAMATFMADYPTLTYGPTAVGLSVPYGCPDDDPRRATRARLLSSVLTATAATRATMAGCFALVPGPHKDEDDKPDRDFYDADVAALLPTAVESLKQGG